MLVKRAAVGPSAVHAWGLIATEPIEPGEVVVESPLLLTRQRVPRAFARHVYHLDDGRSALPCGDGIFTNHGDEPSAAPRVDLRRKILMLVALRMIAIGDEVTIDYGSYVEAVDR